MKYQKGQQIEVEGNKIFEAMGYEKVTGTIFLVNEYGTEYGAVQSIHFKCKETGAMEMFTSQDGGLVTVWN
jgi:hypothetical protein